MRCTEVYMLDSVGASLCVCGVKPWPCRQAQAHANMLAGKQPAAEADVKADNGEAGTGKGSGHAGRTLSSERAPKQPGDETSRF